MTAINAVHTGAKMVAPGRAETIRQLRSIARADRLARVEERVAQVEEVDGGAHTPGATPEQSP
ncbi:hypothetical protein [Rhodococcus koreensis]